MNQQLLKGMSVYRISSAFPLCSVRTNADSSGLLVKWFSRKAMKRHLLKTKLSSLHIDFNFVDHPENVKSVEEFVAETGLSPSRVFRTLLLIAKPSREIYGFCIPVGNRLDMKRAASHVGAKKLSFIDIEVATQKYGVAPNAVSPFDLSGMSSYCTSPQHSRSALDVSTQDAKIVLDETALEGPDLFIGGGLGFDVHISVDDFIKVTNCTFTSLLA